MYGTIPRTQTEVEIQQRTRCQPMYVTFAAIVASVGGILFGYDIGITSGALLQLNRDFHLTTFEKEMIVSSVLIGAFCASFFGGNIVDSWGRKVGITISCFLFIIGALLLSVSINIAMLITGRVIVGIAVSLSVTSECTYISEISPPERRGMMVSLNEVGITVGFLLAYLINYIFISVQSGWTYMFGASAILALIQGFGIIFLPNSHHYLLIKGKKDKARKVLSRLRNQNNVEEEIEAIISAIQEQKNHRYLDLFSTANNMRGRMLLGMALVFLQQFSGHANVLYYAPTVFQHFGYNSDSLATLVTVGLGVVKVLSTLVTLVIVDKVGRRTLLTAGTTLMATSIMVLGILGTFQDVHAQKTYIIHQHPITLNHTSDYNPGNEKQYTSTEATRIPKNVTTSILLTEKFAELNDSNAEQMVDATENSTLVTNRTSNETTEFDDMYENMSMVSKVTSVVALMLFVCAYGISYGPVTWLILSEIFPGSLRGRAVSVATCINWGSNIIVSLTFLEVLQALGIGPTFIVYGFISTGAAIFMYLCVPETNGKTLEEIDVLLSKGFIQQDLRCCKFSRKKVNLCNNEQLNNTRLNKIEEDSSRNCNDFYNSRL